MEKRLQNHLKALHRLARTIFVAAQVNGGTITRRKLQQAFVGICWRPTNGELTDALYLMRNYGKATIEPRPYMDSGETLIEVHVFSKGEM